MVGGGKECVMDVRRKRRRIAAPNAVDMS